MPYLTDKQAINDYFIDGRAKKHKVLTIKKKTDDNK